MLSEGSALFWLNCLKLKVLCNFFWSFIIGQFALLKPKLKCVSKTCQFFRPGRQSVIIQDLKHHHVALLQLLCGLPEGRAIPLLLLGDTGDCVHCWHNSHQSLLPWLSGRLLLLLLVWPGAFAQAHPHSTSLVSTVIRIMLVTNIFVILIIIIIIYFT